MEVSNFPLGLMPTRGVDDAAAMQPRSHASNEGRLFADAEFAEEGVEHVLGAYYAGDRTEGVSGRHYINGNDLGRHRGERAVPGGGEGVEGAREGVAMTFA